MQKSPSTQQKPSYTMARPVKTGLDYFPLHIDFFDDIRIGALAVQYGAKGQLAAIILLVHLYKTGYYLLWDDAARVGVLKDMPGVTFEELDSIVKELVKWDFFDKALFERHHVLTSREVQKHFFNATKRRRNNIAQMPFLLAETDDTSGDGPKQPDEVHKNGHVGQQHAESGFLSTETAFLQADNTQEYYKRDKIIKNYRYSSSTSSSARMKGISMVENSENDDSNADDVACNAHNACNAHSACNAHNAHDPASTSPEVVGAGLVPARNQEYALQESPEVQNPKSHGQESPEVVGAGLVPTRVQEANIQGDVYTEVEHLKSNSQWLEIMCMQRQLTPMVLHQKLDEFARECICRGKTGHNGLVDAQGHFCNWLSINMKQTNTNQQIQPYETIRKHKTPEDHVADAQRWAYEETMRFLQSGEGRGNDVPKSLPF